MQDFFSTAVAPAGEGLRDRKKRETRMRVAQKGLELFLADGFDATTVDVIAEAAGISRRAFFSYFKSKDDIVLLLQEAAWAGIRADVLKISPDVRPLEGTRDVILRHLASYSTDEMAAMDRLMRSSDALLARKQTFYAEQEQALFETLTEVWRQPERRMALRMVAVVVIGALKVTTQRWAESGHAESWADTYSEALTALSAEMPAGPG